MKRSGVISLFTACCCAQLPAQQALCPTDLGTPHLLSGLAECSQSGLRTTFRIQENAEIRWDSLNLNSRQELEFVFTNSSNVVVNRSLGRTTIDGLLTGANGHVVILSPYQALNVGKDARIRAGSFTASTLDAESSQFLNSESQWSFLENSQGSLSSQINGEIITTDGPVILIGRGDVNLRSRIQSGGDLVVASGSAITLTPGKLESLSVKPSSDGIEDQILHTGRDLQARGNIAFEAHRNILLSGNSVFTANQGLGKVYLRVDESGSIIQRGNTGALVIRGEQDFSKPIIGEVAVVDPNEGGTISALSPAVNEYPTLSRNRSKTVYRPTSAPVTARSGSVFSTPKKKTRKPLLAKTSTVPAMSKRSFFRSRATVVAKKRKKIKLLFLPSECGGQ
jgi:filamentous hemagglutinin family protein